MKTYSDTSQTGTEHSYEKGMHNSVSLNDQISSLHVPNGCNAVVYENTSGGGASKIFNNGDHNLLDFNDIISSIRVQDNSVGSFVNKTVRLKLVVECQQGQYLTGCGDGFAAIMGEIDQCNGGTDDCSKWTIEQAGSGYRLLSVGACSSIDANIYLTGCRDEDNLGVQMGGINDCNGGTNDCSLWMIERVVGGYRLSTVDASNCVDEDNKYLTGCRGGGSVKMRGINDCEGGSADCSLWMIEIVSN